MYLLSDDFSVKSTLFCQLMGGGLEKETVWGIFEAIRKMLAKSIDSTKDKIVSGQTCACGRFLPDLFDEETKEISGADQGNINDEKK